MLHAPLSEALSHVSRRLAEPHTLAECAAHRIVFRPHVVKATIDPIERRSIELHLERLARDGVVREVDAGRWQQAR